MSQDEDRIPELLTGLLSKAGRGKDEVVQALAREFGLALAAVLKHPLEEMLRDRQLRITFELVPKDGKANRKTSGKTRSKSRLRKVSRSSDTKSSNKS
jgi:uncharacterized protein YggU (UPF0235/DUF167 family)